MPARSAAKEEIERVERAEVGERPCPSRSKRWRECDWVRALGRVEMRGVKYSEEAPRPWTNTIGENEEGPWEV